MRRVAYALTLTGVLCATVLSISLSSAGAAAASGTKTFASTGVPETFSVPDGVTSGDAVVATDKIKLKKN